MPLRSELAALDREFVLASKEVALDAWRVTIDKPRNADDLISEADYVKDERLPYWADLWPSAESLARYLVREKSGSRGRALELGCGLGLVTLAAMRAGFEVTGTDYYADALRFTARNAMQNLGVEPVTRLVDWRAMPDDLGRFDLVLAADVLYERQYSAVVAAAIDRTLALGGAALMADQGRVGMEAFLTEIGARGIAHRVLLSERPTVGPPGDLTAPGPTVTLYELRRSEPS